MRATFASRATRSEGLPFGGRSGVVSASNPPYYRGCMQIELIAPSSEDSAFLPRLAMGVLAAATPAEHEILYTDDVVRPFDLERDVKPVDLVGISIDTKNARRGYDIARAYRQRGVKVVLGGLHATAVPEEAAQFADAVVVGEAEDLWPELVRDLGRRSLKPVYRGPPPALSGRVLPRRDLFRSKKYVPFQVVQTMRGCPYPCEFCSVSSVTMRFRPVEEVVTELESLGRLVMFADDNVMIHRRHARELFTRMIPLRRHWIGQCSLAAIRRVANVELMAKSGCRALFVGFESVDAPTLRAVGKPQNDPAQYREIVERLHEHGISVWGSFVFGFDGDDPEVFDRTVEFAVEARLTMASFAMLTPYPGTRLYQRLKQEGRLCDERWWLGDHHDARSPYFVPARMTREALRAGWQRAWRRFYAPGSVWHRWTIRRRSSWVQVAGYLPLNLMQRRLVMGKILGGAERFLTDPRPGER
jgi:radical SAM superfamily enzyme YgiQ (UPF0313 family)